MVKASSSWLTPRARDRCAPSVHVDSSWRLSGKVLAHLGSYPGTNALGYIRSYSKTALHVVIVAQDNKRLRKRDSREAVDFTAVGEATMAVSAWEGPCRHFDLLKR